MTTSPENPYVGPRTYLREESGKFFGREQEARDLLALIVSERLVLFYAQSGAGKSSLINTRIIPGLEEKGFEVLPVGRVSGDPKPGGDVRNIYLFNLMHNLMEHEDDSGAPPEINLADFLARMNRDEEGYFYDSSPVEPAAAGAVPGDQTIWPRALIIDQFEEVVSTHPEAWACRGEVFEQIAGAMQADPYLWVVLVMREDYVAALDPFAHLVPGGLRARYYMQQMSYTSALEAIKKPVQKVRPYSPGAAEKLVDDLRAVQVQAADGTTTTQPGQYVEPVQLQVVCLRLWEKLPPGGREISLADLSAVGDVDQSLAEYYAERVGAIALQTGVNERRIRDWINTQLITGQGIRGQVLAEPGSSGGMDNEVIRLLEDAHLVRAEKRGGASWYELTHDRLVEPVRKNNTAWTRDHLSLLQRQAALWEQQRRPEGLLLRGQSLEDARKWADEHRDELNEQERDFLAACTAALEREKIDQERQTQAVKLEAAQKVAAMEGQRAKEQAGAARRLRASAVIMAILLVSAVVFLALALFSRQQNAQLASAARAEAISAEQNAEEARVANTRLADNISVKDTTIATSQIALAENQTQIAKAYQSLGQYQQTLEGYQRALATEQANLVGAQSYYNGLATQNSAYQLTARVTPTAARTLIILPVITTPIFITTKLVPMLPTITSTPSSFSYLGITVSNVMINGSKQYTVNANQGTWIKVLFDYKVEYPQCPTCMVFIQVGLSAQNPQTCVNAGVPGLNGISGRADLSLFMPNQAGKFFLTFDRALVTRCVTDYWWTGNPDPGHFIGRIMVK